MDGSEQVVRCVQLCGCVYRRCRRVGLMLGQRRRISTSIEITMTKTLCLPRWMALASQCSMFLGRVLKSSISLKCTIPVIYMPPPLLPIHFSNFHWSLERHYTIPVIYMPPPLLPIHLSNCHWSLGRQCTISVIYRPPPLMPIHFSHLFEENKSRVQFKPTLEKCDGRFCSE